MKDIVIVGAGGFGREVAWLISDINKVEPKWNILGFVDENQSLIGSKVGEFSILGDIDWLNRQDVSVVFAIGDSKIRQKLVSKISNDSIDFPNLVHPSVHISNSVKLSKGIIVCAGSILTVDINVDDFALLNIGSMIGHDVTINKYATVLPSVNISGNCILGEAISIGTGSAVIPSVTIGNNSVIGAGAVVVKDVPENVISAGVPAKVIREF